MLQTILGAGGAIGIPLTRELKKFSERIRLAGRNPLRINETDEPFAVDVHDLPRVDEAIKGSDVVYVTIGFKYNLKEWQNIWPAFMKAVINACVKYNTRLVFFDNIYMYSMNSIPFMTEDSHVEPPSRKGKIRARIQEMIFDAVEKNNLRALIARSADFYGPDSRNSMLGLMVADNLLKGRKAQAFGDINKIHTFTYSPDAAKATALLGNTPDAFNQVWHVPTTKEKLTTSEWIALVAKQLNINPKIQIVPEWMISLMGLFIPVMREFPEMLYQYRQDYIFDSSKFENRFNLTAISPEEGIKNMLTSRQK